jgi:hypothetical protein
MPTARAFEDLTILSLDDGGGPFVDPREAALPGASATGCRSVRPDDTGMGAAPQSLANIAWLPIRRGRRRR